MIARVHGCAGRHSPRDEAVSGYVTGDDGVRVKRLPGGHDPFACLLRWIKRVEPTGEPACVRIVVPERIEQRWPVHGPCRSPVTFDEPSGRQRRQHLGDPRLADTGTFGKLGLASDVAV